MLKLIRSFSFDYIFEPRTCMMGGATAVVFNKSPECIYTNPRCFAEHIHTYTHTHKRINETINREYLPSELLNKYAEGLSIYTDILIYSLYINQYTYNRQKVSAVS